jgi:hypothetical protein
MRIGPDKKNRNEPFFCDGIFKVQEKTTMWISLTYEGDDGGEQKADS